MKITFLALLLAANAAASETIDVYTSTISFVGENCEAVSADSYICEHVEQSVPADVIAFGPQQPLFLYDATTGELYSFIDCVGFGDYICSLPDSIFAGSFQ